MKFLILTIFFASQLLFAQENKEPNTSTEEMTYTPPTEEQTKQVHEAVKKAHKKSPKKAKKAPQKNKKKSKKSDKKVKPATH